MTARPFFLTAQVRLETVRQGYPQRLVGLALGEVMGPVLDMAPANLHHIPDPLARADAQLVDQPRAGRGHCLKFSPHFIGPRFPAFAFLLKTAECPWPGCHALSRGSRSGACGSSRRPSPAPDNSPASTAQRLRGAAHRCAASRSSEGLSRPRSSGYGQFIFGNQTWCAASTS